MLAILIRLFYIYKNGNEEVFFVLMLSRIKVEGKNDEDKLKFYTGLYHALLGWRISSDVNGSFPARTREIGQIPSNESGRPKHVHFQEINTTLTYKLFFLTLIRNHLNCNAAFENVY